MDSRTKRVNMVDKPASFKMKNERYRMIMIKTTKTYLRTQGWELRHHSLNDSKCRQPESYTPERMIAVPESSRWIQDIEVNCNSK